MKISDNVAESTYSKYLKIIIYLFFKRYVIRASVDTATDKYFLMK